MCEYFTLHLFFITYIPMKCFLTFSCGITIFIIYILIEYFLTFSYGITIYTTYTHMKCFLTFSYEISIYSLKPHEMFLNFSMWNIKISKYFLDFLPFWPGSTCMTWTRPLGRVNPQVRFNNYGVHTVILMWIYIMKWSFCYF